MKRVTVLTRQPGVSDLELERALEAATAPTVPVVLDLPHPDDRARARFGRPGLFPVDALAWTEAVAAADPPLRQFFDAPLQFAVQAHLGWEADDLAGGDPSDVVKQVSFLHATEGRQPEEFRAHYRAHVEVARRHMPSLWQYVQNDVLEVSGAARAVASGVVAISELWFRSVDDFLHRYFASPEDQAEFQSHEGFLDLPKAFSFVCSSRPLGADPHPS